MKSFFFSIYLLVAAFNLQATELTLNHADEIVDGAIEKARALNIKISVAVIDQHGNLKAFKRMDQTPLVSAESAKMKAFTSASVPLSTEKFAEINAANPIHAFSDVPGFLLLQGGLPIFSSNGEHLGGVGIGGGSGDQDDACAQAGLDAIHKSSTTSIQISGN